MSSRSAPSLNLSDGGFLKLGLAVQIEGEAELPPDAASNGARAPDEAISVFGGHTREELTGTEARESVKKD